MLFKGKKQESEVPAAISYDIPADTSDDATVEVNLCCPICGYEVDPDKIPESCPVCGYSGEKFVMK